MTYIIHFFQTYIHYIIELWWSVLLGFVISGLLYKFIPTSLVEKHLSKQGVQPILISSLIGMVLPVCCFGSLPIAVTLRSKGARLGPVLAFLVATPATSVSALIVCWKLLGTIFTVYIFLVVVAMGLIIGFIGNCMKGSEGVTAEKDKDCCHEGGSSGHHESAIQKVGGAMRYAFVTLPKEIGLELLLGIAIASFLVICTPLQQLIDQYLNGAIGYIFVLVVGLATYVCSTASVPMADALIQSGMTSGQAMTYLLVGPITSYGTILVLRKEFGWKILLIYLFVISALSWGFGYIFDILF